MAKMESLDINRTHIYGLDEYKSDAELNDVQLFKDFPDHLIYFAVGCCIVFIIIGIPGNLLTILALTNYRKVRNATAIFIINLSTCDLLNCCVILPVTIQILYNHHWVGGKAMCMAYPIIKYGLSGCSIFNIVAITLNRYIMVAHPNLYSTMYRKRNLVIMIFVIWFGAFTMLIPVITESWGRISLDPVVGFCTVVKGKNKSSPKRIYVIMGFIFPFTVIIICYTRIMWIVRKSTKKMGNRAVQNEFTGSIQKKTSAQRSSTSHPDETESSKTSHQALRTFKKAFQATIRRKPKPNKPTKRDKKLQTMIVAIMITFFVFHLPIMIAKIATTNFSCNPYGNIIGYVMLYMTTCSNPVIYVVLSSDFSKAYKHLLKKMVKIISTEVANNSPKN